MRLRFRLARGLAVVIAIIVVHLFIFWRFNKMQIPVPDMGPVFAELMMEPRQKPKPAEPAPAPAPPTEPAE